MKKPKFRTRNLPMITQPFVWWVVLFSITAGASFLTGCGQKDSTARAVEGHGLLERPRAARNFGELAQTSGRAFRQESADLSSRDLFETDEYPNLKFRVREFSVPPKRGPVSTSLAVP